jgi:hypothetical protein
VRACPERKRGFLNIRNGLEKWKSRWEKFLLLFINYLGNDILRRMWTMSPLAFH